MPTVPFADYTIRRVKDSTRQSRLRYFFHIEISNTKKIAQFP